MNAENFISSGISKEILVGGKTRGVGGGLLSEGQSHELVGSLGVSSHGKNLKFAPLRMHFLHSGAQIWVSEQNTNVIKIFTLLFTEST